MKRLLLWLLLIAPLTAQVNVSGGSGAGSTTGPTGTPTNTNVLTSNGTANQVQDPGGCTMTSAGLACGASMAITANGSTNTAYIGFTSERFYNNGTRDLRLQQSGVDKFQWTNGPYALDQTTGVLCWTIGGCDTGLSRTSATVVAVGNGTQGDTSGTLLAKSYQTSTNCSSAASPAVCGTAAAGSVAVPTGTTPTLVVNTTAVTANSQIQLTVDESLGTKLSVTCNNTLSTLPNPVVTARTAGTSFTITVNATLVTNPACVSYAIVN